MAVDPIPRKLTYEDYLLFPEDGLRHELIDGEHFVSSAPSQKHQIGVANLTYFFVDFLRRHRLGRVFPAPFEVVLSKFDVVQPDLVFVSNERLEILSNPKNAWGSPDLVIEVLSQSTRKRDETLKLRLYERSGVREYWMFDPDHETVRAYRRDGDQFALAQDLAASAGEVLETPLLPGLRIPVAEVFQ